MIVWSVESGVLVQHLLSLPPWGEVPSAHTGEKGERNEELGVRSEE